MSETAIPSPRGRTAYDDSVLPLLKALNWKGSKRHFRESVPHYSNINSPLAFIRVMQNLNYSHEEATVDLKDIDNRLFPCLYVSSAGSVLILLEKNGSELKVFDPDMGGVTTLSISTLQSGLLSGTVYIFKPEDKDSQKKSTSVGWLRKIFLENKSLIYAALFLSFMVNLLALSPPLFVMSVYDRVVGTSSIPMLGEFTIGIVIAIIGLFVFHRMRAKLLAVLGARLDRDIGDKIFERLVYLAPMYTESATVGSQVARIRDFDRLRDFLAGPLLGVAFDLPFVFIAIALIAVIGGNLAFIPITMILIFVLITLFTWRAIRRRIDDSAHAGARQQEFLLETINNLRSVKCAAAQVSWSDRYRDFSSNTTMAGLRMTILAATNSSISDVVMMGAGVALLSFGAIKVIAGTLTVGAMIAIMILIWRVLTPLKTMFNTLPRVQQIFSSFVQITRLMNLEPESGPIDFSHLEGRKTQGEIDFTRVSMRYPTAYTPALMGVNFHIKPGELVGVVGRNGSGKSTLLKLIMGMYPPQAGGILLDKQDIRQQNPIELRSQIAYLPQKPELFYGSIATNLRLANPTASDKMLREATEKAGVLAAIEALPDGFETQIRDFSMGRLSSGFQQSLCLARAYLKSAAILLLDEPGNTLDIEADQKFVKVLGELRGKVTVMMVTHRPSHLKAMDRILVLEQGQLVMDGAADKVLQQLPKEFL